MRKRLIVSLFLISMPAVAGPLSSACVDIKIPKNAITSRHGDWITVTAGQYHFLEGIYVLNPSTPPGLPPGSGAVYAHIPGDQSGVVFFIKGTQACNLMEVPPKVVEMMKQIITGKEEDKEGTL